MTPPTQRGLLAAMLLFWALGASAQPRPAVVELFTSQGCSSCPPADALLGKLSARPDVLALAFHVDYWDDLGWRDRFGLAQSVDRQNRYASNLRRPSVYTPQLVVDGQTDFVGSDSTRITAALVGQREGVPLGVSVREGQVLVDVGMSPATGRCDVVLVAYLRHALSAVGRGENSGRMLEEFNIVRSIQTLGVWQGDARKFHIAVTALPADTTDLAVLVQPAGQGRILGAVAVALR